ncbi:baseplate multidomain protein megatron [Maritalea porphyrae]|uniref:baseplate multidomain protein megatron n=1 Tax=Maritalea porphyrae TaxID=880732 RepID=UPI0022AFC354|nr:glycoside hydrolase TIM-barrel-like domain-containing protein [Maritalea porphyrae]MCZ4271149.1 glycoside hydrolase TIM-barrel-like domain-containing protein [Maritalea porphyrae]
MATLLLAAGGQFIGGALGGPIGATIGRALGAMAGNALDAQIFGQNRPSTNGETYLLNAREGQPIPRLYGWSRISGNIIWATELERLTKSGGGLKSLGNHDEEAFGANFAIGLCEGKVPHIGRIWADGKLMDLRNVNYRFYTGALDQMPDSLIEAKQGAGNAPAYRGQAYIVFEQLDLMPFGNRIPQISVELCRPVGDLENRTKAVCLIPGATEFGYDPIARVRLLGNGEVISENSHQTLGKSDWEVSVDELVALCPNLEHVALVVSWFGDDLRCGECTVTPRVMGHDRTIKDTEWSVAGLSRAQAQICSQVNGGPAYGGTPSDNCVIAAITDLKSRGLKVTIYPLMMMDIAANNQLDDPYSAAMTQANYPWRGRITCNPAIGQSNTVDQTLAAAGQIQDFAGTAAASDFAVSGTNVVYSGPNEWSYRRFILHCASLAKAAGGANAFIVGSEMVALTTVRSGTADFPFVTELKSLANEARAILGAECKLTYAADWSEYHGYQPSDAPGDKLFHLDPLWADPTIDAVGIDNYMPLADWRDFGQNDDFQTQNITHDLAYLKSNIAGGEGYDWYYANELDREKQLRSPISDGAHSEPWVWRYKDLKSWWQNPHHNRIDGVRQNAPTAWVPQSKPFWFTEVGCGAVGNGANQPNAFTDPKSAENKSPYHSDGLSESAIQRQFLRAHYDHWQSGHLAFVDEDNPLSPHYEGRMLDADRIYLWAWDARPFPAFPLRNDVWSDSPSYYTGHWTTGRFGCATVSEIAVSIAKDIGVDLANKDSAPSFIEGCVIASPSSVRDDIELMLKTDELLLRDGPAGLSLDRIRDNIVNEIDESKCAVTKNGIFERSHQDRGERIKRVNINYADRLSDYDRVSAFQTAAEQDGVVAAIGLPFTLDNRTAVRIAASQLQQSQETRKTIQFSLPLSNMSYEAGDVVCVPNDPNKYAIGKIVDGTKREVTAFSLRGKQVVSSVSVNDRPVAGTVMEAVSEPIVYVAQVPPSDNDETARHLVVAAYAKPWPGKISILDAHQTELLRINDPSGLGVTKSELPAAPTLSTWDTKTQLQVELFFGHLSSLDKKRVFNGENRALVNNGNGNWEEIGFANAKLIAPKTYQLSTLLRGQNKTEFAAAVSAPQGAKFLVLEGAVRQSIDVEFSELSAVAGITSAGTIVEAGEFTDQENLPLAPVHLRTRKLQNGDILITWIRRGRVSGNSWPTGDIPLEPNAPVFTVDILSAGAPVRTVENLVGPYIYTSSQQALDFGSPPNQFQFKVSQFSQTLGNGHSALGVFN